MVRRDNFWSIWTEEELKKVPEHHKQRLEKEWNFRKEVFERDNFTCRKCNVKESEEIIYEKNMDVTIHHVIPQEFTQEPDYRYLIYDKDNGVVLCLKCHAKWHKGKIKFTHKNNSWFVYDVLEKIQTNKINDLIKIIKQG